MDFLELVRTLAAEAGTVSPSEIADVADYAPDADPALQDEHVADLVRWIRVSDREIQIERDDWRFRTKEGHLYLDPGDGDYDVRLQIKDYYRVLPYRHARRFIRIGGRLRPVLFLPYRRWAGDFDTRRDRTRPGTPTHFTVGPDNTLRVYPTPNAPYELIFDYIRTPCMMTFVNECEPIIPNPFRMLIVYRALMKHAMSDEAQAQAQRARAEYKSLMMSMRNDQLPEVRVGP